MRIDLEIEYGRNEMEGLLLADVQQKYPAPAGYEYQVKHIFMDRATVQLVPSPQFGRALEDEVILLPAVDAPF